MFRRASRVVLIINYHLLNINYSIIFFVNYSLMFILIRPTNCSSTTTLSLQK